MDDTIAAKLSCLIDLDWRKQPANAIEPSAATDAVFAALWLGRSATDLDGEAGARGDREKLTFVRNPTPSIAF
jgi:hypothetical protein